MKVEDRLWHFDRRLNKGHIMGTKVSVSNTYKRIFKCYLCGNVSITSYKKGYVSCKSCYLKGMIGKIIGPRIVISYEDKRYKLKCLRCGKITYKTTGGFKNECSCQKPKIMDVNYMTMK